MCLRGEARLSCVFLSENSCSSAKLRFPACRAGESARSSNPFFLRPMPGRSVMMRARRARTSDSTLARDRGGGLSSGNRRNSGGDCREDDDGGAVLRTEGRGRRAAPAAPTAAATAATGRAAEAPAPSAAGRVRPHQRLKPPALSSARESPGTATHTGARVGER